MKAIQRDTIQTRADGRCIITAMAIDPDYADIIQVASKQFKGWGRFDGERPTYRYKGNLWTFSTLEPLPVEMIAGQQLN